VYRDELVNLALQFPNIEKKTSWEAAFAAAKQKLGNYKPHERSTLLLTPAAVSDDKLV